MGESLGNEGAGKTERKVAPTEQKQEHKRVQPRRKDTELNQYLNKEEENINKELNGLHLRFQSQDLATKRKISGILKSVTEGMCRERGMFFS